MRCTLVAYYKEAKGWQPIVREDYTLPSMGCPSGLDKMFLCEGAECNPPLWGLPSKVLMNQTDTSMLTPLQCADFCITQHSSPTFTYSGSSCNCYQDFDPKSNIPPYMCLDDGDIPMFGTTKFTQGDVKGFQQLPKCGVGFYKCKSKHPSCGDSDVYQRCVVDEDHCYPGFDNASKYCDNCTTTDVIDEIDTGCDKRGCDWTRCDEEACPPSSETDSLKSLKSLFDIAPSSL